MYVAFTHANILDNRHRNNVWFNYIDPRQQQAAGVWVAPSATVIGNVWLGDYVSVWYGAVLRGDRNEITIGGYTNIQDGVIITTDDRPNPGGFNSEVDIGAFVTVGHGARLHACKIGNECIIGMNSTILEGAIVEPHVIIAAGAVVPPGARIPEGEVWGGNPAKFIRKVGKFEKYSFNQGGEDYYALSKAHALEFTQTGLAYKEVDQIVEQLEDQSIQNENEEVVEWNVWEKMGQGAAVPIFPDQTHQEDFQKNLNNKQHHEHEKKFW
jgi:carbonic anhydrase/acetyltransferase-like protein (isoleucine patch superfamily)